MTESLRDQWLRCLEQPASPIRYLYASGSTNPVPTSPMIDGVVEDFLRKLTRKRVSYQLLSRLHYLAQPAVQEFLANKLHLLLRTMSRATNAEIEVCRRGVRGKVLWSPTLLARASGRADSTTYVVRRNGRSHDLPENRLVKLFLHQVVQTVGEVERLLGSAAVLSRFNEARQHAERALKSPYLEEVGLVRAVTTLMRQRARRNRNVLYGEACVLQQQLDAAVRQSKWEIILSLMTSGWFCPIDDDDLFELYVLSRVLSILESDMAFGAPREYGLIMQGRKHVARFVRDDALGASVYFDQSPWVAAGFGSEYMAIVADYDGVTGEQHRPDTIVAFEFPDGPRRCVIIEAKRTSSTAYMSESIYKVLAYLRDFSGMWDPERPQHPKAILVFSERAVPHAGAVEDRRDLVIVPPEDSARWKKMLNAVLSSPVG